MKIPKAVISVVAIVIVAGIVSLIIMGVLI